jgi:hypothetical protein
MKYIQYTVSNLNLLWKNYSSSFQHADTLWDILMSSLSIFESDEEQLQLTEVWKYKF